jgi:UDP-N-acetylmuramoyl-tripeptide--D-alanyl-D-alanine ligase
MNKGKSLADKRLLSTEDRRRFIALRRAFTKPVIGITGLFGKTTTVEMLTAILSSRGKVLRSKSGQGTWKHNVQILEKLNTQYDFAVFEFDYRQGKNFAEILRLIKPTIGLVTNIGDAHLNYLSGMLKIALKKSEVVKYLARNGVAILNKDDEMCSSLHQFIDTAAVIKYGLNHNADYFLSDIEQLGPNGMRFLINGKIPAAIPIYSVLDVYNFLAAFSIAKQLDFSDKQILEAISRKYVHPKGKGALLKIKNHYILDESYLATPRSVTKAIRSLLSFKTYSDKLIFITGDMSGSGTNIEDSHLNMGYYISALPIDHIICIGNYAHFLGRGAKLISNDNKSVHNVKNVDEIIDVIKQAKKNNRLAISVKGLGRTVIHRISKILEQ